MNLPSLILAFFGGIGYPEMLIVGAIAVLLFGNRLPEVARSMGRSLTEFKKGMNNVQDEFKEAIHSEPTDSIEQEDRQAPAENAFAPPAPEGQPEAKPEEKTAAAD